MGPLGLWPFDSVFVEATPPAAKPEPGELLQVVVDLIDCGERSTHLQDIARLLPAWSRFFFTEIALGILSAIVPIIKTL
jgi:hypothetical protein